MFPTVWPWPGSCGSPQARIRIHDRLTAAPHASWFPIRYMELAVSYVLAIDCGWNMVHMVHAASTWPSLTFGPGGPIAGWYSYAQARALSTQVRRLQFAMICYVRIIRMRRRTYSRMYLSWAGHLKCWQIEMKTDPAGIRHGALFSNRRLLWKTKRASFSQCQTFSNI